MNKPTNHLGSFSKLFLCLPSISNFQCSDMDSSNQAMWREAGLQVGQSMAKTYVQHPFLERAYLFFCPDTPHLLKAMKTALCNHDFIIPQAVVRKNGLPSDTVSTLTESGCSDSDIDKGSPNILNSTNS